MIANLFKRLMRITASVGLMLYVRKEYAMKLGIKNEKLFKGILWNGIVIFIFCMAMPLLSYKQPEITFAKGLPILLFYFVVYMIVGWFEEVLCRGVLFNDLLPHRKPFILYHPSRTRRFHRNDLVLLHRKQSGSDGNIQYNGLFSRPGTYSSDPDRTVHYLIPGSAQKRIQAAGC